MKRTKIFICISYPDRPRVVQKHFAYIPEHTYKLFISELVPEPYKSFQMFLRRELEAYWGISLSTVTEEDVNEIKERMKVCGYSSPGEWLHERMTIKLASEGLLQ